MWLRSDLGITLAGSVLSAWADQSGNGLSFTAAGAGRPTYDSSDADAGNYPSVGFDGTDDLMTSTAVLSDIATASAFEWYVAGVVDAIGTTGASYDCDPFLAESGGFASISLHNTAPDARVFVWDGAEKKDSVTIPATPTTIVLGARLSGGKLYTRLNDGAWSAGTNSGNIAALTGTLKLGAVYNNASYAQIKITEIVAFKAVQTSTVSDNMMTYLNGRYR